MVRYRLDELNRLIVSEREQARGRLQPVRILDGSLRTDPGNRLVYHVETTSPPDDPAAHQVFNFDGTWKLTRDHALALALHEGRRQARQTLYLKGALVNAEVNALVFALQRHQGEDLAAAQQLTLSGRWQADARNRLTFLARKAQGREDRLTLQGGWDVGPRHELLYRYRQRSTLRRRREEQTIGFAGAWDITSAGRLVYRLSGSTDSAFEFSAGLQSPSVVAREGRIVYDVGIGLSGGVVGRRRVTLVGAWKLHRDLSVSFEVPYADGRVQAIRFEGTYAFGSRNRIALSLQTSRREPLGLTVTFTRELFPDAELFLRLRQDAQERSALGGVTVRF